MASRSSVVLRLLAGHLEDPGEQRRDLPVREPRHGLADRAGQVHREVEVDQPGVDEPDQRRQRLGVGAGEGLGGAVLREAQRPPEPTRLLEVDAGLGGELGGGEDARLAEDVLLEVLAGSSGLADGSEGWLDTFVAAVLSVCRSCSRSLSLRWASSTRGMSGSATWPCVLASLITSVPQPSSRSIEVLLVGDVADPGQRDVVAPAGDHAVPGDQPAGGDRVGRGQPDQERAQDEPDDADATSTQTTV